MSLIRNVMIVSLSLFVSLPLAAKEKDLDQVYQTVIRDSQKKLSPALGKNEVYLPTSWTQKQSRSPASDSVPTASARHAAMPWAADAAVSNGLFSVK